MDALYGWEHASRVTASLLETESVLTRQSELEGVSLESLKEMLSKTRGLIANIDAELAELGIADDYMRRTVLRNLRAQADMLSLYVLADVPLAQMNEIKDAVEARVADPGIRQELSDLVSEFAKQQQELAAQLHRQMDDDSQELRRIEIQERKWNMRKALFIDREPAAVLVGGFLLIVVTGALIVGMFSHTTPPEILANAFLLILGFFFGQSSARENKPPQDHQS